MLQPSKFTIAVTDTQRDILVAAARCGLAAIFVLSGSEKLMHLDGFAASLLQRGVPFASGLAVLGACVECFGGLAILLGVWTRPAAVLMAIFTVVATAISHRYWEAPEAMRTLQHTQFMKNVAIIGGFLALSAGGGGRFSVDGLLRRR